MIGPGDENQIVVWSQGRPPLRRGDLRLRAAQLAHRIGDRSGELVWIATADPRATLLAVTAAMGRCRPAVVPVTVPAGGLPALCSGGLPTLVVHDSASVAAGWARSAGIATLDVDATTPGPDVDLRAGSIGLWTSGSTGRPRLVELQPSHIEAAVTGVIGILGLSPLDISLGIAPLDHTLGLLTSAFAALAAGGGVVLAPGGSVSSLRHLCAQAPPTWCAAAPTAMRLLPAIGDLPALRFLRTSGAGMPPDLAERLENRYGVPAVNAYAMTEAPGEITSQPLVRAASRRSGSVGVPTLSRVEIRPADVAAGPDPDIGTVWVSGSNILTGSADGRLNTGDLGYLTTDGELVLTGRLDDVVNRGGEKISPHWVETVTAAHPDVAECAAFPLPQATGDTLLGLAVVLRGPTDERTVRHYLAGRLSPAALPHRIYIVPQLPRSARGKLTRRLLAVQLGLVASTPPDPQAHHQPPGHSTTGTRSKPRKT
ncbi:AMP-binding protein [Kribbella sp. NPDC050820]|uniref:AMP-binding protein n=1 Tax=Kribbella sp. NPDC050820 TaxID=3155408 RepID=UPI0033F1AD74